MTSRTITAVFDSSTDAEEAQARLLSLGLRDNEVRVISQSADRTSDDGDDKGLWETIKDFFVSDDDRSTYEEGLRRGAYLLTANIDDERTDEVIAILEESNAIDLDERTRQWRSEGWTGGAHATETVSADRDSALLDREYVDTDSGVETRSDVRAGDEQAIPIVREQLRVGKREVNRGGVRVRSYVVEEPVEEQIDLREEHVEVERRPVGGGGARVDADELLQERTIEMTERAEEAIVAKEAEVTEEVVVRKFEGQRTEGVSDTVRHTEVDVEDNRTDETPPPPQRQSSRRSRPSNSKPAR
jgi:uncharacterized protein (TIGR02271 family)